MTIQSGLGQRTLSQERPDIVLKKPGECQLVAAQCALLQAALQQDCGKLRPPHLRQINYRLFNFNILAVIATGRTHCMTVTAQIQGLPEQLACLPRNTTLPIP